MTFVSFVAMYILMYAMTDRLANVYATPTSSTWLV